MASVTITSLSYDVARNQFCVMGDFTALGSQNDKGIWVDANDAPLIEGLMLEPEAIGERISAIGYANGNEALTAIVLEHAIRVAPDVSDVTVDWQSPSDAEKAAQLDALSDRIEAARVFFS